MRSTFKQLYYINRNRVKADGTTAILCRISIDGKSLAFNTGFHCDPNQWNSEKGEVSNAKISNSLKQFKQRIDETYETMLKEQRVVSAELLKNTILGVNSVSEFLLQAGNDELGRLEKRSVEIQSRSTYRQSIIFQKCLKQYVQTFDKEDMHFSEITEQFGLSYKLFLLRELSCSTDKMNKCLCWLNRLIYIAVDREVLRSNPIEDVQYEKKAPPKLLHISRSELKKMMETPMEDKMMELARRMFIFSSFTGLAYVDILRLYPHHIGKTVDGELYIREKRGKTKVEAFVPLHPVARQIFELYNTTDDTKPVFPLPIRDILWYEIHSVGIALEFKENLSHHMARHSFGTLMLSAGIPIESISKMMGHTNITTTQGYAKVTDQKISEDMDKLMKRRKITNK